jgi:heterodisulfide reductase subunit A
MGLCPYEAITYDDKEKRANINEVLCTGCGVCVSVCPSGAIKSKHFTDEQLYAEIEGLVHEWF